MEEPAFLEAAGNLAGQRILDLGCGDGHHIGYLCSWCCTPPSDAKRHGLSVLASVARAGAGLCRVARSGRCRGGLGAGQVVQ